RQYVRDASHVSHSRLKRDAVIPCEAAASPVGTVTDLLLSIPVYADRGRIMDPMQSGAVPLPEAEARRQLRRAVIASTVGTTIEWYDFFLYSTVTGLVFAKLYFPESDPLVGTLQAFLIYAVGFVARPVGAAI